MFALLFCLTKAHFFVPLGESDRFSHQQCQILFPTLPNKLVNRYRNHNDAEEYAKLLTRTTGHKHQVIFDRS
jgi:hypothetical protein